MSLRLLLLMQIVVLLLAAVQCFHGDGFGNYGSRAKRSDNGTDLHLSVGKEVMIPEVIDESDKENEKEANKLPSTDVIPLKESEDKQEHDKLEKEKKGKNIETGMPPKYPLKAESAETSAHDNEIGGCRDHPRAGLVCSKCENGNKCFPAEHESYTYSYCRRSCRHCDPSTSSFHTFWRLRSQSEFEPTWMLQQVEFYADPQEKISLVDDPEKAYASSVYTGYKPSFAFDNNNGSAWYPSGWGNHDNNDDWIAYEFTVAVRVHGVRMVVDKDHATAQPKKVIVEASDKMYGPFQKKWTIYNNDFSVDKVYKLLECDVLWRRLEVEDGAWCFRLVAKLETWEGARKSCEIEGGDLATISNKEEQRFVTDEVGLCSHTWFGLSHTNEGYYWNDGSNSTFRNWKDQLSYSDVQKQTLNCAAMDPDGVWFNFHCSNKFYFLCKKRLVPRPDPRPDLTDNAWPYPPEVPPLIFFAPNVTVPVINSKNLEPGIFPDSNGKVDGEDSEEDITLSDLFYEQTVEHLKEKGLKPSEEIEADENQEETDFTQELNKIAINTSPGDFQNETKGDTSTNNTATAHKQEQDFENIPNKEANNAVTSAASSDAPKPKLKHKDKPVPPPPEEGDQNGDDNSYPEIKHGKPVDDSLKNKTRKGKKVPKGNPSPKDKQSSSLYAAEPDATPNMMSLNGDEQPDKAGTIGKQQAGGESAKKKRKKPVHQSEEDGDAGKNGQSGQQSGQSTSQNQGMYFYVPNTAGSYTLMKMLSPMNQTGNPAAAGQAAQPGSAEKAPGSIDDTQSVSANDKVGFVGGGPAGVPGVGSPLPQGVGAVPQGTKPRRKKKIPINPSIGDAAKVGQNQTNNQTMYFYMPNSAGSYTLMKTISPINQTGTQQQASAGQQAQLGSTPNPEADTGDAAKSSFMNLFGQNGQPLMSLNGQNTLKPDLAHEQPQKAENIEGGEKKKEEKPTNLPAPIASQQTNNTNSNNTMYFYVPNNNGTFTLMRTVYPFGQNTPAAAAAPAPAPAAAPTGEGPPPTPPPPKEGDKDDDSEDSMEEPPEVKQGKNQKGESQKNKDIPTATNMNPFTGPLGGPSLAQQNISKSARKKIKVLQPLESAAQGEDYSIMSESNKMQRKKVMTRHMIHTPKAKAAAKKRKRNRHMNHLKHTEHDSIQNSDATNKVRHNTEHVTRKDTTHAEAAHVSNFVKENDEDEEADEEAELAESGSGSGTQVETDNADIFPEQEEFWSR